ncbi:PAS domain S-box protein [Rubellimicrobium arenae]|uniref:PAS domain S-box protein n=1 Tax=Rubellimicrobium arenae TaxID=2817372 RepID=UPI001B314B4B|nr:PAS domain S-box protein [Rubellimicrobium arenae]
MRQLSWVGLPALLGLAVLGGAAFQSGLRADADRAAAESRARHHVEVLVESQRVLSALQDAETGQRGYLLTGDPVYLGPYIDGRDQLTRHMGQLRDLTVGNVVQSLHLGELVDITERRVDLLVRTLDLAQQGDREAAIDLVNTDLGRAAMDEARTVIGDMISEEERVLAARSQDAAIAAQHSIRLFYAAGLAGLALILLAAMLGVRAVKAETRARGMQALARSEAERLTSVSRLEAIVDTAVDAIVVIDERGMVQSFNPAAVQIFGYQPEEVIGRNLRLLMPPGNAEKHDGFMSNYLHTGQKKIIGIGREVEGLRSDGTPVSLDLSISEWKDANGQRFFTGVMRDISLRRRAEDRLQESETRFRQLAETIDDTFYILEPDEGHVSYISPAYERIMGRGAESFLHDGSDLLQAVHPEDRADVAQEMVRQFQGDDSDHEFRVVHSDGSVRHVRNRVFRTTHPRTGQRRVVGVMTDVTDRRAAENALRQLNETLEDKVATAVAEREAAAAQLHEMQKLDTIGQLTGGVAHDFNNLLTPIVGSLERAQKKLAGDERTLRLIGGGLEAAERARVLVSRLLAFARRAHLEARPVDIAGLVHGMTDLIQRSIGPQITVVFNAEADLPAARVDPNQLELALLNLAVNARDAMPSGGLLTIAASHEIVGGRHPTELPPGCYLRLSVTDTGAGMEAETLRRCIEPFYSTKGVGRGTGLGLSMVHGLAAQSGGRLMIASTPGMGTRTEIWLPRSEEAAARTVVEPPSVVPAAFAAHVLLVDDEELVRVGTADMLRDLGYHVTEARTAFDALKLLSDGLEPDLLVTDHLMPGMTGMELASQIRRDRPRLPVLLITGYAEVAQSAIGGVPRLAKPFRQADLSSRVAGLLDTGKVVGFAAAASLKAADGA